MSQRGAPAALPALPWPWEAPHRFSIPWAGCPAEFRGMGSSVCPPCTAPGQGVVQGCRLFPTVPLLGSGSAADLTC